MLDDAVAIEKAGLREKESKVCSDFAEAAWLASKRN
jgi:hypothetical protein